MSVTTKASQQRESARKLQLAEAQHQLMLARIKEQTSLARERAACNEMAERNMIYALGKNCHDINNDW